MSFDRLAPFYRTMELLLAGNQLQRCRLEWIHEVSDCRKILILGEGPGRFLEKCASLFPLAQITCVDASRVMLSKAQKRLSRSDQHSPRINFIHAHLPQWEAPAEKFDLVVTHFFLDCFPPHLLKPVISNLSTCLQPQGKWLLSDFAEPDHGFKKYRAKFILFLAYTFFKQITNLATKKLILPDPYLNTCGLRLEKRKFYNFGLLHSDLWIIKN